MIPEGILNVFVVKYDSIGNVILTLQSKGPGEAYPISIAVDTSSNIYLTGCFEGSVIFGNTALESFGSFDIFTVKYDANGDVVWVRQAGSSNYDSGRSIKVDLSGNVYVIGVNSLSADFNGTVLNKSGAFLAKYDRDGNLTYSKNIFTVNNDIMVSESNFSVNDFALVENKGILVTGFFNETVHFDSLQVAGLGGNKIFVAKITDSPTEVVYKDGVPSSIVLNQNYPNPFNPSTTISFNLPSRSFVSLKVFDLIGREVAAIISEYMQAGNYSRQWNASDLPSGIYFYRLQSGTFTETKKLILLK